MSELPSGTVSFLFTDIEGSTRLLKHLRNDYPRVLADHHEVLQAAFAAHDGLVVDTQGDAFFVVFRRAQDAVEAALAGQRSLQTHAWPEGVEVRVRMGIHTGQSEASGGRYHGLSVHRAARIGAAAHGGQVLVSQTARDLLDDEEEESVGVSLRDLGEQRLKDLDRPVRLYQLEAAGLEGEFPPLRTLEPEPQGSRVVTAGRSRWRWWRMLAAGVLVAVGVAVALVLVMRGGSGSARASAVAADSVGVFQAGDGRLVAQVAVRARPNAVASGADSVWVTNTDDDSVSRIDPVTKADVQTIQVGSGPTGIAVGGGFVWVANSGAGTVSKIDPRANGGAGAEENEIPVGNEPSGVAFGLGAVWVANVFDRTVVRINPGTGAPSRPIGVGTGADGIAVGAGAVWVTSEAAGTVTRIDPRTGAEQPISVGSGPTAVAYGAGSVWVANSQAATVSRIDPASNQVVTAIPVGDGPSGISVAGSVVWVSNELAGTISRIDPAQNRVVQTLHTGNRPQGVAVTANSMYVAVRSSGLDHRGGTLTEAVTSLAPEPDAVNPERSYDAWNVLSLTNDGLIGYRRVGGIDSARLVPDLATAIPEPSNSGTTYTFQLRSGIHYSTGQLVRPGDFRRAIERTLTTQPGVPQYYAGIVGAAACTKTPTRCDLSRGIVTDAAANTVTFNLTAPDPDFLYKLALPMADAVPASVPLDVRRPLPATGPYMIASYNGKRSVRLVRNPRFHVWSEATQPNGYPDEIVFHLFKSGDAAIRAVERQKADVTDAGIFAITPAARAALRNGPYASQLHSSPGNFTGYVALNTRLPPFNDVRVRQALNYAVDRRRHVALGGGPTVSQPACHVLPPNFDGYRPYCLYTTDPSSDGGYHGPDLDKARRLIAASGTKGQKVVLLVATCCVKLGPAEVVSVLKRLGYRARLDVNNREYQENGNSSLRVQAIASIWGADYPSAADFFTPLLTCASFHPRSASNSNLAEFCNSHIDAEIARARALETQDPQAASVLWTKIDREVTKQAPWVFTTNPRNLNFVSSRVGNYQYSVWVNLDDQLWVH